MDVETGAGDTGGEIMNAMARIDGGKGLRSFLWVARSQVFADIFSRSSFCKSIPQELFAYVDISWKSVKPLWT